jgi:hypothetical protein
LEKEVLDWLLAGPAWLKYAVERQLLDIKSDAAPALRDAGIRKIISRLKGTEVGIPALKNGRTRYDSSGNAYWDLFFLADIGLTITDCSLEKEAEQVFMFQSRDGSFVIPPNVKDNYFCMSAILISSLAKMGYRDDPRLARYIRAILSSQMGHGGWDCYGDSYGGEGGSCPQDDMNILMLLGQYDRYATDPHLEDAIDCLLQHWMIGDNRYGYGVGRRFRSLHYPAVKYGILRVLDVLSLFPHAIESVAFQNMLDFVRAKAVDGKYTAESLESSYSDFDFGQTAAPSRWITFLVERIEKRVEKLK